TDGLLVVAARDADHARLERLGRVLLLEAAEPLEQLPELGRRLELVRDSRQRRALLRPRLRAERRHLRLLVPRQQAAGLLDVVDLAEAAQQLIEVGPHDEKTYNPGQASANSEPTSIQTARANASGSRPR